MDARRGKPLPGDWKFKFKNSGKTSWPKSTIFTYDSRKDLPEWITPPPIEIYVGDIAPGKYKSLEAVEIMVPLFL